MTGFDYGTSPRPQEQQEVEAAKFVKKALGKPSLTDEERVVVGNLCRDFGPSIGRQVGRLDLVALSHHWQFISTGPPQLPYALLPCLIHHLDSGKAAAAIFQQIGSIVQASALAAASVSNGIDTLQRNIAADKAHLLLFFLQQGPRVFDLMPNRQNVALACGILLLGKAEIGGLIPLITSTFDAYARQSNSSFRYVAAEDLYRTFWRALAQFDCRDLAAALDGSPDGRRNNTQFGAAIAAEEFRGGLGRLQPDAPLDFVEGLVDRFSTPRSLFQAAFTAELYPHLGGWITPEAVVATLQLPSTNPGESFPCWAPRALLVLSRPEFSQAQRHMVWESAGALITEAREMRGIVDFLGRATQLLLGDLKFDDFDNVSRLHSLNSAPLAHPSNFVAPAVAVEDFDDVLTIELSYIHSVVIEGDLERTAEPVMLEQTEWLLRRGAAVRFLEPPNLSQDTDLHRFANNLFAMVEANFHAVATTLVGAAWECAVSIAELGHLDGKDGQALDQLATCLRKSLAYAIRSGFLNDELFNQLSHDSDSLRSAREFRGIDLLRVRTLAEAYFEQLRPDKEESVGHSYIERLVNKHQLHSATFASSELLLLVSVMATRDAAGTWRGLAQLVNRAKGAEWLGAGLASEFGELESKVTAALGITSNEHVRRLAAYVLMNLPAQFDMELGLWKGFEAFCGQFSKPTFSPFDAAAYAAMASTRKELGDACRFVGSAWPCEGRTVLGRALPLIAKRLELSERRAQQQQKPNAPRFQKPT